MALPYWLNEWNRPGLFRAGRVRPATYCPCRAWAGYGPVFLKLGWEWIRLGPDQGNEHPYSRPTWAVGETHFRESFKIWHHQVLADAITEPAQDSCHSSGEPILDWSWPENQVDPHMQLLDLTPPIRAASSFHVFHSMEVAVSRRHHHPKGG